MIKVIEHGDAYSTYVCQKCHCVIEATLMDLPYTEVWNKVSDINGIVKKQYYYICPECGERNDI